MMQTGDINKSAKGTTLLMRTACFKPGDTGGGSVSAETSTIKEKEPGNAPDGISCRCCGLLVTSRRAQQAVDGKHVHVFANPHGHLFEIGCYATARGVRGIGPSSDEFSWFPGYMWTVCVCSGCRNHLGWHFKARDYGFYGLILQAISS